MPQRSPSAPGADSVVLELLEEIRTDGPRPEEKRYQWIKRAVCHAGQTMGLSEECPLPTEHQLAERFQVSRQTVRRALDELVREAVVTRAVGRGTFLLPPKQRHARAFASSQDLLMSTQTAHYEIVTPLRRMIDIAAAGRMRQPTDVVHAASFRRLQEGVPIGYTTVYMPPHVGEFLSDIRELHEAGHETTTSVIELLDERVPGGVAGAEQSITATPLPVVAAQHLGRTPGEIALQIDLLFFDQEGAIIELQSSCYLPNAYSHRSTFRRVST